jgi:hypothetical protein
MVAKISDEQLLNLNFQGFIPGPKEDVYHFLVRVQRCLAFANEVDEDERLPFLLSERILVTEYGAALRRAEECYGISPVWVPAFYSDRGLSFFHGGCSWIPFLTDEHPLVYIQLREAFKNSQHYLKIYHQDELLCHEWAHVGRMAFEESDFEELFAYRSSDSALRKWFGPLVMSPTEVWLFIGMVAPLILLDFSLLILGMDEWLSRIFYLKALPLLQIGVAFLKLFRRQRYFTVCLKNLRSLLGNKQVCDAVMYRLTDEEIRQFADEGPQSILQYAYEQRGRTLRWRLLFTAYF